MKYILSLFIVFFAGSVFAQTPSLYDTWSPMLAGTEVHVLITKKIIVLSLHDKGFVTQLPEIMALPSPKMNSDLPVESALRENARDESDTLRILKVVYDSGKAMGRIFLRPSEKDKSILPLSFLLKDNGEVEIGIAGNISELMSSDMKSLKQVERSTRPGAKHKVKTEETIFEPMFDLFGNIHFTFFNQARTAEFAAMKDPATMPKEEVLAIINSFGNRMSAALQEIKVDTTNSFFSIFSFIGPMLGNLIHISHDIFVAHGYNPLGVISLMDKMKDDSDIVTAIKVMGDKIEESVPALRDAKIKREIAAQETITEQIGTLNSTFQKRTELIATMIEQIKSSEGVDQKILAELISARSNAAGVTLSPEILKDSLAFQHFNQIQHMLQIAIRNARSSIEQNETLRSNDDISQLLAQMEEQENQILLESARWNELSSGRQSDSQYQHFMPREGEEVTFPDSH